MLGLKGFPFDLDTLTLTLSSVKYFCHIRLFPHLFIAGLPPVTMNPYALLLIILSISLCTAPETHTTNEFDALDRLLEKEAEKNGGMALILIKDGKVIYDKGFSRLTTDSVIPIASASKWLSGGVIMSLVDDGILSLDDKASLYLPNFTQDKGSMTVRQLFSHTSGLPGGETGRAAESRILANRKITLAQSVDMIAGVDLLAPPGTQFCYGGLSMQVAGRIAEVASEEEWTRLFEERIASPLDMGKTDYQGLGPTKNPRIAGSIRTSARQYSHFLEMLLNKGVYKGRRVLSEEAVREMLRDQTGGVPIYASPWQRLESVYPEVKDMRYGIGVWLEVVDEQGKVQEACSPGAFGFSPWIDLDRTMAGVLAVKGRWGEVVPFYFEMKELIKTIVDRGGVQVAKGYEPSLGGEVLVGDEFIFTSWACAR